MDTGVNERCLSDKELYEKYSHVLPTGRGACVDSIGKEEVSESMVVAYFGKKSSKSGWKYDCMQTPEEAATIYDLWQRVYDDRLMPNREISLQFARGLILQSQDKLVNWMEFAVGREKFRNRAGCTKKATGSQKAATCKDTSLSSGISVLGKRRCSALTPPPSFKLTIKEEAVGTELEMRKKGSGRNIGGHKKSLGLGHFSPIWIASGVNDMVVGIADCEKIVLDFQRELEERCLEKERLEVAARRAQMLLSNRLALLDEAKAEVQRLGDEETLLESGPREKNCSSVGVEQSLFNALVEKRVEIATSKRFHERTVSLSTEVVSGCRDTISSVETCLLESSNRHKVVSDRVSSMHIMLDKFRVMVQRMQEGGGNMFYPRPIFSNPESPISTVHLLNACPLCGYWYSCNNFVSLGCGHTYHHWCLSEHSQKSGTCLIETCLEPFLSESTTSIGIRLQVGAQASTKIPTSTRGAVVKDIGGMEHASHEVHSGETSWGTEQMCKGNQILSQSSETTLPNSGSTSNTVETWVPQTICVLCNIKVAAVILKSCGHNVFCFKCIQGLRMCPLCKEPISGWDSIKSQSQVNPMLLSLGGANDILLDPLLPKVTAKKTSSARQMQQIPNPAEILPGEEEVKDQHGKRGDCGDAHDDQDFAALSDADDDDADGLIHWSADDTFRNGATRSASIEEMQFQGNKEVTLSEVEATEFGPKVKRPRVSKTTKALDELCGTGPHAAQSVSVQVESTNIVASLTKKKPGRSSGASKAGGCAIRIHSNATKPSKKVSSIQEAGTSHLRCGSARNVIPAKFRNL